MNKVAERINLKFTSGNSIPVERAVIKTTEWQELLQEFESALAAERERADKLAQALEKARTAMKFYIATAFSMSTDEAEHSNISAMQEIDAALSDWRTARGAK